MADPDTMKAFAQERLERLRPEIPEGYRVAVVVTDAAGEWVGVATNTTPEDTADLLFSAALGAESQRIADD